MPLSTHKKATLLARQYCLKIRWLLQNQTDY